MTSVDTDVSSYTISELMAIIEVNDIDPEEIVENTNVLISKFKDSNPQLSVFFMDVQSQLLQYSQGLLAEKEEDLSDKIVVEGFGSMTNDAIYPAGEKQVSDWYKNENLTQTDQNQVNKITNRQQKIGVFGNEHAPMKREQIATTDNFQLPVKQDSLNPNLKNTINRFVNLDSQFRQYTSGADSNATDYTLDLSDTLKNTLSMRVYSYQIPYSWYAIDTNYGNTCLWIIDNNNNYVANVSIASGNYTQTQFVSTLGSSFASAGFDPSLNIVQYNQNSGNITLNFTGVSYTDSDGNIYPITSETSILFYDFTGEFQCNNTCYSKTNSYFNNTLGWLMGYRVPYLNVDLSGNTAPAILDLNGPKYLILVIDDYNQNHVNNTLVSISQFSNTLKMPSYYSPDLPYTCILPNQNNTNLQELIAGLKEQSLFDLQNSNPLNGLLIAGKYNQDYTSTQVVLPSAPRTLTQAQIYTINQISANSNNLSNYLSKAPTTADIIGILPIKTSTGIPTGTLLVDFSGSLQDNSRTYFGPVNIDRMAVKLLDDKG
ncbi:MAG: hypothetical protein MUO21_03610, partial [Nitrososphaeraceae archaeon]|nr:hypothetical protein [Nitrososphaeraceae archaeon]